MYQVNGSLSWRDKDHISIDLFGDYKNTVDTFSCEYKSVLTSTVEEVPSLSASLKHDYNISKLVTDFHVMVSA